MWTWGAIRTATAWSYVMAGRYWWAVLTGAGLIAAAIAAGAWRARRKARGPVIGYRDDPGIPRFGGDTSDTAGD